MPNSLVSASESDPMFTPLSVSVWQMAARRPGLFSRKREIWCRDMADFLSLRGL